MPCFCESCNSFWNLSTLERRLSGTCAVWMSCRSHADAAGWANRPAARLHLFLAIWFHSGRPLIKLMQWSKHMDKCGGGYMISNFLFRRLILSWQLQMMEWWWSTCQRAGSPWGDGYQTRAGWTALVLFASRRWVLFGYKKTASVAI
jgi:hypothetical protein